MNARAPTRRSEAFILVGPDPDLPKGGVAVAVGGFAAALRQHQLLAEVVRSYEPGVRTAHMPRAAAAIRAAIHRVRATGRQPVVWAHAGGPVSVARKAVLLRIARARGARTLLQLHSVHTESLIRRRRTRALTARALRAADDITCVAPYWQRLVSSGLGRDRVYTLSNPLPDAAEAASTEPDAPRPGPLSLLCMTHLAPNKGLELAIDALAAGPAGSRLEIAGIGPLREALQARVERAGLADRVRFLGWVEGTEKDAAFRRANAFILPTRYDSFGMGFVEAAAYGLPSIALRYKAVPEVVLHGHTGRLASGDTAQDLARELQVIADPGARARLGRQARQRARSYHGRDAIVGRLLRVLDAE